MQIVPLFLITEQRAFVVGTGAELVQLAANLLSPPASSVREEGKILVGLGGLVAGKFCVTLEHC